MERGLSLNQVAEGTGISSSFLSLVEHGKSDIAVGRLLRLAEFYDLELSDLIMRAHPAKNPIHILRAEESNLLHSGAEGVDVYELSAGVRGQLIPLLSVYEPAAVVHVEAPSGREGVLFVVEGRFEIRFGDRDPTRLEQGEGVLFKAELPYRVSNVAPTPSRLLSVAIRRDPHS
jgi:transcriptional regulator with XRE-family HTH domain